MKNLYLLSILAVIILASTACAQENPNHTRVKVGAEVLIEDHLTDLEGKRVGLVMNPTARIQGIHMLDTLLARQVNIRALFAPEHGFRGEAGAGEVIEDGVDKETGLPVYSLYGDSKKPTPDMLKNVDILLFDMQDVGARFYTYNVTLGLVLEAAAEQGIPVWVLDRPNPAGGEYISGWVLQEGYESFVGAYPVPMAHGMTLGELAQMMMGEGWIKADSNSEVRVIPAKGWERSMKWPETGLEWYPPSPNLPTFEHAYLYLGTVLFEGTNISEGRGTQDPFLTVGSPTTELTDEDIQKLNQTFPSVRVAKTTFTPRSIPGKSLYPKYEGKQCHGLSLSVRNYDQLDPVSFGIALLKVTYAATGDARMKSFMMNLAGIPVNSVGQLQADWQGEVRSFRKQRAPYLIY